MKYQVEFTETARYDISRYVDMYADYFLEIFSDTGIWSEEQIREGYRKSAKEIYHVIYDVIESKFVQEVLPYTVVDSASRSTVVSVGKRMVAIQYVQDSERRIITHLRIWYKH